MREHVLEFACQGESLLGILAEGVGSADVGVVIVVGGPQYRIGSHRLFVQLSRSLATAGYPCLRFDHRGMGDNGGEPRSFDLLNDDIAAAISALQVTRPEIRRVVLWGLCDAASAILLYWAATRDPRVAGLVLANPWVRSEQTQAVTMVKHYYRQRLLSPAFWRKLLSGGVGISGALSEYLGQRQRAGQTPTDVAGFQAHMRDALLAFAQPVLLIMSGRDYTANEFDAWLAQPAQRAIRGLLASQRLDLQEADHTFASASASQTVADATCAWLCQLEAA